MHATLPFDLTWAHKKALAHDAVAHPAPLVVERVQRPPLSLRTFDSRRAYKRPLAILRITDDTRVDFNSVGRLVGAVHYYFVIDSIDYEAGKADVILGAFRTRKTAGAYIDAAWKGWA